MKSKTLAVVMTSLLLLSFAVGVQATTITSCTLDREIYEQGETGYVSLTVYNNMDNTIRVTQLTATINYYYTDGTVYLQTFFTNTTLPVEIIQGQSGTFVVPFSLPTNIASGYTRLVSRAWTDLWNTQSQRWYSSDNPTAEAVMYIESPYKQQFEDQQTINQGLQDQLTQQETTISQLDEKLQTLQTSYNTTTLAMYILIFIVIALMATMAFLMRRLWKTKAVPNPQPQ